MSARRFLAGLILLPVWALAAEEGAAPITASTDVQVQLKVLDQRMARIEQQLQNHAALSLLKEVEGLKAELSRLRGQSEQQEHQIGQLEKRQKDLYVDLDKRVEELGKQAKATPAPSVAVPLLPPVQNVPASQAETPTKPAVVAGAPVTVQAATPARTEVTAKPEPARAEPTASKEPARAQLDPLAESKAYETALNAFRAGNHAAAVAAFRAFLKTYPESTLASNAQYWLGYAHYAQRDYRGALEQQKRLLATWPQSAKVPDAMLNMANCMIELDDLTGARKTLEEIVSSYPGTNAAAIANKKLALLKP